jgi:hypothetical protein
MSIQDSLQTALFDIPSSAHDPGGKTMIPGGGQQYREQSCSQLVHSANP